MSGIAEERVVFQVRIPFPLSIRMARRVAVMAFVFDPRWNLSVVDMSVSFSSFRTPATASSRVPFEWMVKAARPGRLRCWTIEESVVEASTGMRLIQVLGALFHGWDETNG
jgi:hypothetical protein